MVAAGGIVMIVGCARQNAGGPVMLSVDAAAADLSAIVDVAVPVDLGSDARASDEAVASVDSAPLSPDAAPRPTADAGSVWAPAPGTSWQWQLTQAIDTSVDVKMYDLDLFDVAQGTVDALHGAGRIVICYFSAGSQENWRSDAASFPAEAVGRGLDGWPGEKWIDTRNVGLRAVMTKRLDLAAAKKCDGVEPDNVDGYSNNSGFPLTAATQIDYDRFLAHEAHARGLSVGLKNDVEQVSELQADFDWALNESCLQYDECDTLAPFIRAGKAVFHVEYGDAALADTVCPKTKPLGFSTLIKKQALDAWRVACP